jgi:phage shock protein E
MARIVFALLITLAITGCSGPESRFDVAGALEAVDQGALLIDVRSPEEFAGGHLDNAINIPHGEIVEGLAKLGVAKSTPVVVYCRSGNRSGKALDALTAAGFATVTNAGPYEALRAATEQRP